ncbi:3-hydroxyacyl-CoA dehydrogenase NAD-binding domain-containing protein, partial [Sulfobacillus harzensis]|nr:hypothetical protein [Sulfobacillus harzensis]
MDIRRVMVAGSGVLGSQIAFQTAYHGYTVMVYDISGEALRKGRERMEVLAVRYAHDLKAPPSSIDEARGRMAFSSDLAEAVKNADLVIEAIPEILSVKQAFYQQLGRLAPANTIFATNSSTLIPRRVFIKSPGSVDLAERAKILRSQPA